MRRRFRHPLALPLLLSLPVGLPLVGCSDGTSSGRPPQRDAGGFFSDSPAGPSGGRNAGDGAQDGAAGGGGGGGEESPEVVDRTIVEADIIQVQGNTLYALSRFAGLSIIDLSDAARPRLLGRYSMTGVPFEMYLQGTTVYAMFSSFGHYAFDEAGGGYRWVQSSHVAALDVRDPAKVALAGEFDLPGEISDSRVVGDVLYAVTYEDGYCWRCEGGANTTVTSFAVGNPADARVVDQLRYTSDDQTYGWSRRSVTVTPERMYIAGVEWNQNDGGEGHSTIQVVDISDPGGKLVEGAKVEATGQIESRWQIDEHAGVLRVISQPGVWASAAPPVMQTFAVASSQSLVPLGTKPMVLPKPERLRSVRFDGTRAFAITAERTDPLFALDFADPADPKQLGQLEIPGWVYHLEVRGDRILALGFDNQAPEGALNVSLFDVADMSAPRLAKRVNFGGTWGSYAEDQDRVHKAFSIVPELGLVLVPFSGWSQNQNDPCGSGTYQSGIQLVDFTGDDLTLRGVAPQKGEARRAFLHEGSLYAVSDEGVRSFGIENRDAPARRGELALASNVDRTVLAGAAGDKLVRFGFDWWTNEARLEIVPAAGADAASPLGALDLSALAGEPAAGTCRGYLYGADIFANGDYVYVTWVDNAYFADHASAGDSYTTTRNVTVVNVADPAHPVVVSRAALPFQASTSAGYYGDVGGYYGYGNNALVWSGQSALLVGSTLVFESFASPAPGPGPTASTAKLTLVDLSDPAAPRLAGSLDWARGESFTGLVAQGSTLLASHAEPLPDAPGKVRFFVDRVDVSNPDAPAALPPVNTPGSLLAAEGDRLVAVDYARFLVPAANADACYKAGYDSVYFDYDQTACVRVERTFRLLDVANHVATPISDVAFPTQGYVTGVFTGDDRVFATTSPNYGYAYYADGPSAPAQSEQSIFALGGMRDGALRGTLTPVSSPDPWWWSSLRGHAVAGQRLLVSDYSSEPHLAVFDATNLDAPTFDEKIKLRGYLNDVLVTGDSAVCSLGQFGVQSVPLAP